MLLRAAPAALLLASALAAITPPASSHDSECAWKDAGCVAACVPHFVVDGHGCSWTTPRATVSLCEAGTGVSVQVEGEPAVPACTPARVVACPPPQMGATIHVGDATLHGCFV